MLSFLSFFQVLCPLSPCSSALYDWWFHSGGAGQGDVTLNNGILHWEEHDVPVDSFIFLPLGSTWDQFWMFANMLFYTFAHFLHIRSFFIHMQLHTISGFAMYIAF